jgi:uncharacterized membrane protein YuzA (DUF378 family)
MDYLKRFEPMFLFLVVIGALNWGMVGFFGTNVVTEVFSNGTVIDVIYAVVGVAGLLMVPRLLDWLGLHLGTGDHARPSGA